ncbi:MAG: hypothetical protein ABIE22_02765 [archaeon]
MPRYDMPSGRDIELRKELNRRRESGEWGIKEEIGSKLYSIVTVGLTGAGIGTLLVGPYLGVGFGVVVGVIDMLKGDSELEYLAFLDCYRKSRNNKDESKND